MQRPNSPHQKTLFILHLCYHVSSYHIVLTCHFTQQSARPHQAHRPSPWVDQTVHLLAQLSAILALHSSQSLSPALLFFPSLPPPTPRILYAYLIENHPNHKTTARTPRNILAVAHVVDADLEAIAAGARVVVDLQRLVVEAVFDFDFVVQVEVFVGRGEGGGFAFGGTGSAARV